jgi:hypothetical protein
MKTIKELREELEKVNWTEPTYMDAEYGNSVLVRYCFFGFAEDLYPEWGRGGDKWLEVFDAVNKWLNLNGLHLEQSTSCYDHISCYEKMNADLFPEIVTAYEHKTQNRVVVVDSTGYFRMCLDGKWVDPSSISINPDIYKKIEDLRYTRILWLESRDAE